MVDGGDGNDKDGGRKDRDEFENDGKTGFFSFFFCTEDILGGKWLEILFIF